MVTKTSIKFQASSVASEKYACVIEVDNIACATPDVLYIAPVMLIDIMKIEFLVHPGMCNEQRRAFF